MTQLDFGLFGEDPQCQYPNIAAASGWRYGCRCPRCRTRDPIPSQTCNEEGCDRTRVKYRRWCTEHIPPPKPSRVRTDAPCQICGEPNRWYESVLGNLRPTLADVYRTICRRCRAPFLPVIKNHHLDVEWAKRIVTCRACDLCGRPFPIGNGGRPLNVIDHDHRCCPDRTSCGRCVRGILCYRCNTTIGGLEAVTGDVPLDRLIDYIRQTTPGF